MTPRAAVDVAGTVERDGDELVFRMKPSGPPVGLPAIAAPPDPTTLAHLGFMRYVGPLTPAQATETRLIIERWDRQPRWLQHFREWLW